ncbi:MAG: HD domain-containing protein [Pseudomonadota bacterium]
MLDEVYLEAKKISERIASEMEPPRFYLDKKKEIEASHQMFESHPMVEAGLRIVEARADRFGHGFSHVRKVAIDAGALVIIERGGTGVEENVKRMVFLAHMAGLLHDIKREEPEHAQRGAEEASKILMAFDLNDGERRAIIQAIRNHEAFKPAQPLDEPSMQLLSDALYDADKFRWGPDNFTETVWMMVARMKVPLATLLVHFIPSLQGIERIKNTFRTSTGKEYGPDFISRGLEIGRRLYVELEKMNQGR